MMKHFTLDDWLRLQDEPGDSHVLQSVLAYDHYYQSIRDRLPADFVQLQQTVDIKDAQLLQWHLDWQAKRVTIVLLAYDKNCGPSDPRRKVCLHYEEACHWQSIADPDRCLPGSGGYGDLGSDEVELLDDESWEHRLLFSSSIELSVRFRRFWFER